MEKTTGYAPVNGIDMYYEIYGSGDIPLVLVHGGGSTIETVFSNILHFFTEKHQVIAVELQAHGRTGDRDQPESFKQDAADVAGLLKYLKVEKANVLGFSDGGCTTLQLAISYPQLLNKIIVVSSNYSRAGMIDGFFEGMEKATFADMPRPLKDGFLKVNTDQRKLVNMFNKDRARRIAFEDFNETELKAIHMPTLLMVADKDVIRTEEVLKLSRLIPNAQLTILPGYHGTMLGEVCTVKTGSRQPEISAILVNEFLAA
ncbi:alpha/beta hydrolase [Mucilaginibacter sp. PPCGB 2223]|uniref:alpha/beta fold hydrolase n=1 Tax=Mucilaginibacter sp. PPCGB 2223 TaxID=1886027 RepID=UPI000825B022|nr:alpha/beta hydrolase [Mucilaginibacter sp. PPCGB 2223]OCX52537.1 alpha/beta hydrolase [Mucilaginibacter sp. PPCGB 2223]